MMAEELQAWPVGQAVQFEEPAAAYVPAEQAKQAETPRGDAVPPEQTDAVSTVQLYPPGHGMQFACPEVGA